MDALRKQHAKLKVTREEFIRVVNWLDAGCQYYPSYWGQKNLKYAGSPYFRPTVSFEEAVGTVCPEALKKLYTGK